MYFTILNFLPKCYIKLRVFVAILHEIQKGINAELWDLILKTVMLEIRILIFWLPSILLAMNTGKGIKIMIILWNFTISCWMQKKIYGKDFQFWFLSVYFVKMEPLYVEFKKAHIRKNPHFPTLGKCVSLKFLCQRQEMSKTIIKTRLEKFSCWNIKE